MKESETLALLESGCSRLRDLHAEAAVRSLGRVQLFVTPMDCSPPGSSVHGIFQARILEWVAISSSRGSSPPRDRTHVSFIGRRILYR